MSIADDQTLQNLTSITLNNLKSKPRLGANIHTHIHICTYTHVDINQKIFKSKSHHGYHTELLTVYWLPSNCQFLMRIYVYVTQIRICAYIVNLAGSKLHTGIFDLMLTLVSFYPF